MNTHPLVSVIILSWNRRKQLRETLRHACALEYQPLEVIVVDNGSVDGSRELVRKEFPNAVLVPLSSNTGIAGWNEGTKRASGEYFLMLDDDAYVQGKDLESLVTIACDEGIDILSFPIAHPNRPEINASLAYPTGLLSFWGCAVLISRKCFQDVGGFEPRIFIYAHELDFTIRSLAKGFRIGYTRAITGFHRNESIDTLTRQRVYYNSRNLMRIAIRYFTGMNLLRAVTARVLNDLWLVIKRPLLMPWFASGAMRGMLLGMSQDRRPTPRFLQAYYVENSIDFAVHIIFSVRRRLWGESREKYFLARMSFYPEFQDDVLWSLASVNADRVEVQIRRMV